MTKHVKRLELRKFLNFSAAHSPVRLDIDWTKFLYFLFLTWTSWLSKLEIRNFVTGQAWMEAVDGCICCTQKIQYGGDWERSRPQGPHAGMNYGTEMLLILKKLFSTWLLPIIFRYDSPKKCPTICTRSICACGWNMDPWFNHWESGSRASPPLAPGQGPEIWKGRIWGPSNKKY